MAAPPDWLTERLCAPVQSRHSPAAQFFTGANSNFYTRSIADVFCANTSWSDILCPHGWT